MGCLSMVMSVVLIFDPSYVWEDKLLVKWTKFNRAGVFAAAFIVKRNGRLQSVAVRCAGTVP
jgi:hypothetical protein